jgi:hypothetical protein
MFVYDNPIRSTLNMPGWRAEIIKCITSVHQLVKLQGADKNKMQIHALI